MRLNIANNVHVLAENRNQNMTILFMPRIIYVAFSRAYFRHIANLTVEGTLQIPV